MRRSTVGAFGWKMDGCPHMGGDLAFTTKGDITHAAVWTGLTGREGAYYLRSVDGAKTWSKETLLDTNAKQPHLAANDNGQVAFTWQATGLGKTGIFFALSKDGGLSWGPVERLTAETTFAAAPIIVAVKDTFRVFWSEKTSNGWRWNSQTTSH